MIMDFDRVQYLEQRWKWVDVDMKDEGVFELVSRYEVTIEPIDQHLSRCSLPFALHGTKSERSGDLH